MMNSGTSDTPGQIFKSSVATLRYDPAYKLVYLRWDGALTLEKYKEPFLFLLDQHKPEIHGILTDIRNQGVVGPEMRKWLQHEATPRSYKKGLRFFYIVSDTNVFKQYYVNTVLKLLGADGIDRKLFTDFETAEKAIKDALAASKSH